MEPGLRRVLPPMPKAYTQWNCPAGSYNVSVSAGGVKIFQANAVLSPGQALTLGVAGALIAQADSSVPAVVQAITPASCSSSVASPSRRKRLPSTPPQIQTSPASDGKGSIDGKLPTRVVPLWSEPP